jgi:hypothetical protein
MPRLSDYWDWVDEDCALNTCFSHEYVEKDPSKYLSEAVKEITKIVEKNKGEEDSFPLMAVAEMVLDSGGLATWALAACLSAAVDTKCVDDANRVMGCLALCAPRCIVLSLRKGKLDRVVWTAKNALIVVEALRAMRYAGMCSHVDLDEVQSGVNKLVQTRVSEVVAGPVVSHLQNFLFYNDLPAQKKEIPTALATFTALVNAAYGLTGKSVWGTPTASDFLAGAQIWVGVHDFVADSLRAAAAGGDEAGEVVNQKTRASRKGLEMAENFLKDCGEALASVPEYDPKMDTLLKRDISNEFAERYLAAMEIRAGMMEEEEEQEPEKEMELDDDLLRIAEQFANGNLDAKQAFAELANPTTIG